ncbi:MAG TPA: hypothetical protein VHK68_12450 [Gemmatimonadales bacterium]|nr:hypothetical protein [Gemmatimonadales bacterium]
MRLSSNQGAHMRLLSSSVHRRRGITVLGLAILIIVIVVLVIFLVRYLGQHPATTSFLNQPVAPDGYGSKRLMSWICPV